MLKTSWEQLEEDGILIISDGGVLPDNLPPLNEYGFYYGVEYYVSMGDIHLGLTFNEDGSFAMNQNGEIMEAPAGSAIYDDHLIDTATTVGVIFQVSTDGTRVKYSEGEFSVTGTPPKGYIYTMYTTEDVQPDVSGDIVLPADATWLSGRVFFKWINLTGVIIPEDVTYIDYQAFHGCKNLTNIKLPNNLITIGESAFNYCFSFDNITIPGSVINIGSHAFLRCDGLTNVVIQDGVTVIGRSMFNQCRSLSNVIIPDSVTSIGEAAFEYCDSLTTITIPESVTSIGTSVFAGCSQLTTVEFGANSQLTNIGNRAF
jgi:hypothetical protein